MSDLFVLLDGRVAGRLTFSANKYRFRYDDDWRTIPGAYPLSLSMPVTAREHGGRVVEAYLWGLLPDNELTLSAWARKFQVSALNPFALLSHMGEDCQGAVQFVRPERLDAALASNAPEPQWLTEAEMVARLTALRTDGSAGRTQADLGQFSLAGAQPKTALLHEDGRWAVPSGRMPTTHILKLASSGLDGLPENEHLCLTLARRLGLPAVESRVLQFGEVTAISTTRYDRIKTTTAGVMFAARGAELAARAGEAAARDDAAAAAGFAAVATTAAISAKSLDKYSHSVPFYRVHQEDICQAIGLLPSKKYQAEGGPSPEKVVSLLRNSVSEGAHGRKREFSTEPAAADLDVQTFTDALIFNWLIGGTDAHAKNYSLMIGGNGMVRLAPLYDVASILAYPIGDAAQVKLAMKIGGTYRMRDIGLLEWRKLGSEIRVDQDAVIERIGSMATELPDRLADEIRRMQQSGLSHPVLPKLGRVLPDRARMIAGKL